MIGIRIKGGHIALQFRLGPCQRKSKHSQTQSMKSEYDFPKGIRGKFYHPDAVFSFPVYLEPDVNDFMNKLAEKQDIDVQKLVNEWLRANIKLLQSVQRSN